MNENIERALEIGTGVLMCMIAISLFFVFQKLINASYDLLFQRIGG